MLLHYIYIEHNFDQFYISYFYIHISIFQSMKHSSRNLITQTLNKLKKGVVNRMAQKLETFNLC